MRRLLSIALCGAPALISAANNEQPSAEEVKNVLEQLNYPRSISPVGWEMRELSVQDSVEIPKISCTYVLNAFNNCHEASLVRFREVLNEKKWNGPTELHELVERCCRLRYSSALFKNNKKLILEENDSFRKKAFLDNPRERSSSYPEDVESTAGFICFLERNQKKDAFEVRQEIIRLLNKKS